MSSTTAFATKYRVARDDYCSNYWAVQYRVWWWPFWREFGNGLLRMPQEAEELIKRLKTIF